MTTAGPIATYVLLAATDSTALLTLLAIVACGGGLLVALIARAKRLARPRPHATFPQPKRNDDGGSDCSAGWWMYAGGSGSTTSPNSQSTPVAHQAVVAVAAHHAFASSQPASYDALDGSHDTFDCDSGGGDSGGGDGGGGGD